jgi:hypothetical protein
LKENKKTLLIIGIICDALGYLSLVFPVFDFLWAPLSAYLMLKMYKGTRGKIAAGISFLEEALPFLDIIPTFTLMWVYTFLLKSKAKKI